MSVPPLSVVWLERRAREAIAQEAARRRLRETGGALFGYESAEEVVVACAFGPGPNARHGFRSFIPDPEMTRRLISSVRCTSEGRYRFLGSWHTHPGGTAVPSPADEQTASDLSGQPGLLLPRPLLLIQATRRELQTPRLRELRAWRYPERGRLAVAEIVPVDLAERHCPSGER